MYRALSSSEEKTNHLLPFVSRSLPVSLSLSVRSLCSGNAIHCTAAKWTVPPKCTCSADSNNLFSSSLLDKHRGGRRRRKTKTQNNRSEIHFFRRLNAYFVKSCPLLCLLRRYVLAKISRKYLIHHDIAAAAMCFHLILFYLFFLRLNRL